ncbi:MAG: hypothetical protein ABIH42_10725, partial [Planctomycetota bacterium]
NNHDTPGAIGANDPDYQFNSSYSGHDPENFSIQATTEEDSLVLTLIHGYPQLFVNQVFDGITFSSLIPADAVEYPEGSGHLYMETGDMSYNPYLNIYTPVKFYDNPGRIQFPEELTPTWCVIEPQCHVSGTDIMAKIGRARLEEIQNENAYNYGLSQAYPDTFGYDYLALRVSAGGEYPDTPVTPAWYSEAVLSNLVAYPEKYDFELPYIPEPLYPLNQSNLSGLWNRQVSWDNTLGGKQGVYRYILSRELGGNGPFVWVAVAPIPNNPTEDVVFKFPELPVTFSGPVSGVPQAFSIEGRTFMNYNYKNWYGNIWDDNKIIRRALYTNAYFTP